MKCYSCIYVEYLNQGVSELHELQRGVVARVGSRWVCGGRHVTLRLAPVALV